MGTEAILFYILAGMILTFAAMCVFSRRIFRSALYLLFALIGIAGIYLLMDMNFVAALQIMIYVGGIVVLIIFSIFLTHNTGDKLQLPPKRRMFVSLLLPLITFGVILWVWLQHPFKVEQLQKSSTLNVRHIGLQLFNYNDYGYIYPFEMVSILLLATLIGSIVIAQKNKK
ncbi:MAG: NADH-quinone oxidoreductase subunit J [Bacteroidales bacterium]